MLRGCLWILSRTPTMSVENTPPKVSLSQHFLSQVCYGLSRNWKPTALFSQDKGLSSCQNTWAHIWFHNGSKRLLPQAATCLDSQSILVSQRQNDHTVKQWSTSAHPKGFSLCLLQAVQCSTGHVLFLSNVVFAYTNGLMVPIILARHNAVASLRY